MANGRIGWAEVGPAGLKGRIGWSEVSAVEAVLRGRIGWAEVSPTVARGKGRIGWAEVSAAVAEGILGSVIRAATASGTHGAGLLFNDLSALDDLKRYRFEIVTPPSAGTFTTWEDGSFTLAGAPAGMYPVVYRLYENGADLGTATASITVSAAGVSVSASILGTVTGVVAAAVVVPDPAPGAVTVTAAILGTVTGTVSAAVDVSDPADINVAISIIGTITGAVAASVAVSDSVGLPPLQGVPWQSLVSLVAQHCPNAPTVSMEFWARQAAAEFCERTLVHQVELPPFNVSQGSAEYALNCGDGLQPVKLLSARINGAALLLTSPAELDSASRVGTTDGVPESAYLSGTDRLTLYPTPSSTASVVVRVALEPTHDAATLASDVFTQYGRAIAFGAVKYLAMTPDGRDDRLASAMSAIFEREIGQALARTYFARARSGRRTPPTWF